ncbi:MAG TPA: FkbM family methyltransferase [Chryseolinea sp.]|nr:FkbM family methyltransferase [Chryseolinea sp.]
MKTTQILSNIKILLKSLVPYNVIVSLNEWRGYSYEESEETIEKRSQFYHSFLEQGDLVFDVGSNYGNRVRPLLSCKCKVVAIEPQPDCVRYLTYKFGTRISIERCCLGANEGTAELSTGKINSLSTLSQEFKERTIKSGRFESGSWSRTITVRVTTLDHLIQRYGIPKFVKIDTEGFEKQVLLGLSHNVPLISFEYTLPEMALELKEILSLLAARHSVAINFCRGEEMRFVLDNWMTFDQFIRQLSEGSQMLGDWGDIYVRLSKPAITSTASN